MADQRQRQAFHAGTAGAADAVHVILGHRRQVEVDHDRQLLDVDAAGGDIGGDQHGDAAGLEIGERTGARILALVTVDRGSAQAGGVEEGDQLVGAVLGAAKHQGLPTTVLRQHVQQQVALARGIDRMHLVADQGGDGVRRRDRDLARVVHEVQCQRLDRRRKSGREQQGLTLLRYRLQDALQRRQEAHVEHAVGFVQHQRLYRRQIQRALLQVVDQPAGGGDDHVHTAAQRIDLRAHADAAEDGGGADMDVLAVVAHVLVDLRGQLTGGGEDQRARAAGHGLAAGRELLQQRQCERGGLAGTGLRGGEQVVAFQRGRNRGGLDRGGLGVAVIGKRTQQRGRKAQRIERHGTLLGNPECSYRVAYRGKGGSLGRSSQSDCAAQYSGYRRWRVHGSQTDLAGRSPRSAIALGGAHATIR